MIVHLTDQGLQSCDAASILKKSMQQTHPEEWPKRISGGSEFFLVCCEGFK
jgi:hypothetical protein